MSSSRFIRSLLLFLFLALLSTAPRTAQAQGAGGRIGIFSDTFGADCALSDAAAPNFWYIVHTRARGQPGAWQSRFSAPLPPCYPGMWLADNNPFPVTIGFSQTGVTIEYGRCLTTPIHVLSVLTFGGGTSPCCSYKVLPHPAAVSGQVELGDCEGRVVFVDCGEGIINHNATCP